MRSLPDSEIDHEPNGSWLRDKLGFVTDEHQMNVALTRAKRGLCIIGKINDLSIHRSVYICYLPAGRSVLAKTVPEVLSTARGRRLTMIAVVI